MFVLSNLILTNTYFIMRTTIDITGNVDFTKKSSTRKLLYDFLYITKNRMVLGNSKLENILIFDLPAVKSCLNCADCKATCYAVKAQRQYTNTRIFRDVNMLMSNKDKGLLKELLVSQLRNTKKDTVRIHSSGDFYSQSYIEFWNDIINMFPHINFYAYTKVEKILDFSEITKNKNFNLISSLIGGKINFGSIEYCKEMKKEFNSFICPATKPNSKVKCNKECSHCVTKSNVVFIEH